MKFESVMHRIETLPDFIRYYTMKFRERSFADKANKAKPYNFSAKRFKTHFEKIWHVFSTFPQVDPKEYTDCVFRNAPDIDACMPHRFISRRYISCYNGLGDSQDGDQHHLHQTVRYELMEFASRFKSDRKYFEYFSDKFPLPQSIELFNFPPQSILSVSRAYRKYRMLNRDDKLLPDPEKLSYIVPVVRQHVGLLKEFMEVHPGELDV